MLHLRYEISESDYIAASRLALRSSSKLASFWLYAVPVFAVFLIVGGLLPGIRYGRWGAGAAAVIWGSLLLLLPLLRSRQFRKNYQSMPLLQGERTLDADETGLHFTASDSESRARWSTYTRFFEDPATFILFQQGNRIFIPVPKRALSAEEIDQFRQLLQENVRSRTSNR